MAYGDKPKRQKDDMGNKGRRSGKGPKPMKGAKKARRESAKQERKNLLTENPVVNRSKDSGFDYTQSKRQIKKKYKKGSDIKDAVSTSNMQSAVKNFIQDFNPVRRYQGVTKKLGNTKAMSAMMSGKLKEGLSAGLSKALGSMGSTVMPQPKVPTKLVKQPLRKQIKAPITPSPKGKAMGVAETPQMGRDLNYGKLVSVGEKKGSFTPSKRDMELKDAHLGTPTQQSADPAKLTYKKAGGPVKPKRQKAKRKKRTIKAKF